MHIPRLAQFSLLALTVSYVALACGGQTGEVAPDFCDGPISWLSADDDSVTGFDADEVLSEIPVSSNEDFTWTSGATTDITITVAYDMVIQNDGMIAAVNPASENCVARLEVPVSITLETQDGKIGETLTGYMLAETPNAVRLQADLYASSLLGNIELAELVPEGSWDPSTARLFFDLQLGDETSGTITLNSHQESGGASQTVLGTW